MGKPHGVGILGGGAVTQAIHLPALATMPGRFRVVRVMDVNAEVATRAASRCNAVGATKAAEIYDDKSIKIVAICSPHDFHAEQVIACCKAGKKIVMCEKPMAVSTAQAEDIVRAARLSGTALIVGTMHAYDPAYRAARAAWLAAGEDAASFVQSEIYLPTNDVFIDQATDQTRLDTAPARPPPAAPERDFDKRMFRAAILGLAIHDIPVLREFYPVTGKMVSAAFVKPFGYSATLRNGEQMAQFSAMMPGRWPPLWSFQATGKKHELRVFFPPSCVLAGSARAELVSAGETRVFEAPINGYEALWTEIGDIADGKAAPSISIDTAVADLAFALDLADQSPKFLQGKS